MLLNGWLLIQKCLYQSWRLKTTAMVCCNYMPFPRLYNKLSGSHTDASYQPIVAGWVIYASVNCHIIDSIKVLSVLCVRPSVLPSDRPSIRPSVHPSIQPSDSMFTTLKTVKQYNESSTLLSKMNMTHLINQTVLWVNVCSWNLSLVSLYPVLPSNFWRHMIASIELFSVVVYCVLIDYLIHNNPVEYDNCTPPPHVVLQYRVLTTTVYRRLSAWLQ